jgi:hypothetical protein
MMMMRAENEEADDDDMESEGVINGGGLIKSELYNIGVVTA